MCVCVCCSVGTHTGITVLEFKARRPSCVLLYMHELNVLCFGLIWKHMRCKHRQGNLFTIIRAGRNARFRIQDSESRIYIYSGFKHHLYTRTKIELQVRIVVLIKETVFVVHRRTLVLRPAGADTSCQFRGTGRGGIAQGVVEEQHRYRRTICRQAADATCCSCTFSHARDATRHHHS